MVKTAIIRALLITFVITCAAYAEPYSSVKNLPHSVMYPEIRTKMYRTTKEKRVVEFDFESAFGVRRWLNPTSLEDQQFKSALYEAYNWQGLYGGYGVLGHGEDVFTREAAYWRGQTRK